MTDFARRPFMGPLALTRPSQSAGSPRLDKPEYPAWINSHLVRLMACRWFARDRLVFKGPNPPKVNGPV